MEIKYKKQNEQKIIELAMIAEKSILTEAFLYPKPGLVDFNDSGAHRDMDIYTFIESSVELFPGFVKYANQGFTWDSDEKRLFESIRPIGMEIEKEMFNVTNGVNTHKGVIFSLGICVTAIAYLLKEKRKLSRRELLSLFQITVKRMANNLVNEDFSKYKKDNLLSNGEKIFLEYGYSGIRGEAEAGYPTVTEGSLQYYTSLFAQDMTETERSLRVLLYLMMHTEDTNVLKRGGREGSFYLKNRAAEIFNSELNGSRFLEEMTIFNEECIEKNISPGGAADLLSVTYFLYDCVETYCTQ